MQPRSTVTKDCICKGCTKAREWRVAFAAAAIITACAVVAGLAFISEHILNALGF